MIQRSEKCNPRYASAVSRGFNVTALVVAVAGIIAAVLFPTCVGICPHHLAPNTACPMVLDCSPWRKGVIVILALGVAAMIWGAGRLTYRIRAAN